MLNFYQIIQEELPSILLRLLHEIERKALLLSLYTDSVTSLSKLDQDTRKKLQTSFPDEPGHK